MGDFDVVVMTHQSFTALASGPAVERAYLADLIERYQNAMWDEDLDERSRIAKRLAKQVLKLKARYAALMDVRRDDGLCFEQLGIDYVFYDEAHALKSLALPTRMEGFSLPASKRALDWAIKLRWLREANAVGRSGAMLTGTPVSNSLVELLVVLLYGMPTELEAKGLDELDAFAGQFIEWQSKIEVAPDGGGFRLHRRPSRFTNVPELRLLLGEMADIRTRADMGLAGPAVLTETVVVPPSPELLDYVKHLVDRANKIHSGSVDQHTDNMLSVCNDGRRAALWLPLVGITADYRGKVDVLIDKVAGLWRQTRHTTYPDHHGGAPGVRETTPRPAAPRPGALQIIFCDLGTPHPGDEQVYGKIRAGLIAAGMPAKKIRYIHEAGTDGEKAALYAACRTGDVAVLIGSTEKLGTGVNIQHRCVALHHLDAPWRPADVEQREGRAVRPGNANATVRIYRYVTERSFDAYMWQALERKALFITQILTGSLDARDVEDIGPVVLAYSEVKALAAGQPLLAELAQINAEITELNNMALGHAREQRALADEINWMTTSANTAEEHAAELEQIAPHHDDPAILIFRRHRYDKEEQLTDPTEIGAKIAKAAHRAVRLETREYLGRWRGIAVAVSATTDLNDRPAARVDLRHGKGSRPSRVNFWASPDWLEDGECSSSPTRSTTSSRARPPRPYAYKSEPRNFGNESGRPRQ
jgi:hypothetical protein